MADPTTRPRPTKPPAGGPTAKERALKIEIGRRADPNPKRSTGGGGKTSIGPWNPRPIPVKDPVARGLKPVPLSPGGPIGSRPKSGGKPKSALPVKPKPVKQVKAKQQAISMPKKTWISPPMKPSPRPKPGKAGGSPARKVK